jgi:GNAT superfamily N-acetyltransferase
MPIRIKMVATPNSLPEHIRLTLNKLDETCFPTDTPYPKDGCWWWIAYDGKEPVAFAGLKPLKGYDKGRGFLCRAGVLPKAQGQKIQRRLIRCRLRKARISGIKEVITYTNRWNFSSAFNLIKEGMRMYQPSREWGVEGAMYFRKDTQSK